MKIVILQAVLTYVNACACMIAMKLLFYQLINPSYEKITCFAVLF